MIADCPDEASGWMRSAREVLLAALQRFPQPLSMVPRLCGMPEMEALLELRLIAVEEWVQTSPIYQEPGAVSLTPMGLRMAKYLSDSDSEVTE